MLVRNIENHVEEITLCTQLQKYQYIANILAAASKHQTRLKCRQEYFHLHPPDFALPNHSTII